MKALGIIAAVFSFVILAGILRAASALAKRGRP
jgi:hypothetical protein